MIGVLFFGWMWRNHTDKWKRERDIQRGTNVVELQGPPGQCSWEHRVGVTSKLALVWRSGHKRICSRCSAGFTPSKSERTPLCFLRFGFYLFHHVRVCRLIARCECLASDVTCLCFGSTSFSCWGVRVAFRHISPLSVLHDNATIGIRPVMNWRIVEV